MRVLVAGASGLIGSAVRNGLQRDGHTVHRLVRTPEAAAAADAVFWSPAEGSIDAGAVAGYEVVINLAGENIFGPWTPAKKRRIYDSRVQGTRLLAEALAGLRDTGGPHMFINGSAKGYYGDRPHDEPLTEESGPGETFMARLVRDWEAASDPAARAGVRVVLLRFGLVVDPQSLLLKALGTAARFGLAAKLGSGRQVFPWVTRDEIVRVVRFVLARTELEGPVNVVGREKVTNQEFTDAVARAVGRPRFLRVPEFALRATGDLGEELLASTWVVPEKLTTAGYEWRDPELEGALRRLLEP